MLEIIPIQHKLKYFIYDRSDCQPFLNKAGIAVSIAIDYELQDRMIGVRNLAGAGNFSLRHRVQTGSRAHPGALSLGVKRPGREAGHSLPCNAEVRECMEPYLHSPLPLPFNFTRI
jgi:hypothetical protein